MFISKDRLEKLLKQERAKGLSEGMTRQIESENSQMKYIDESWVNIRTERQKMLSEVADMKAKIVIEGMKEIFSGAQSYRNLL